MRANVIKIDTVFGWNVVTIHFETEEGKTYLWETTSNKAFDDLLFNKVVELKSFKLVDGCKNRIKNVRYSIVNA